MAEKDKAEELEQNAEKTKAKKEKPLPALVSPTVNLVVELRQAIAIRCRDTEESFSLKTNKMWLELLKSEKTTEGKPRVRADLQPDFSAKRVGGGMKLKLEEKDETIAKLMKELEELKAAKTK